MPFIKIIRPINCLFAFFTTFLGFWYLSNATNFKYAICVSISSFLIAAAGYVINDYFDYEIDKINQPKRVLPQGQMTLKQAKVYSIILFILGISLAFYTLNIYCIILSILNSFLLFYYAYHLKKTLIFGNILVSWNACSTFLYGAFISLNVHNILHIVYISFFYTIIREWVKNIEDYEGDKLENVHSIAVVYGKKRTGYFLLFPAILLIIFIFLFNFSTYEIIILNLFISLPVILLLTYLNLNVNSTKRITLIQKFMKLNMMFIVIIFVLFIR